MGELSPDRSDRAHSCRHRYRVTKGKQAERSSLAQRIRERILQRGFHIFGNISRSLNVGYGFFCLSEEGSANGRELIRVAWRAMQEKSFRKFEAQKYKNEIETIFGQGEGFVFLK